MITCGLCGHKFEEPEGIKGCGRCGKPGRCRMVRCPKCFYENPPELKVVTTLKNMMTEKKSRDKR